MFLDRTGRPPQQSTKDESIDDRVADFLVAGENVEIVHNDAANTLEISAEPGAGGETATSMGNLINSASSKATPVDADLVAISDSAAGNILRKLTWANLKATAKTYFDTLYDKTATVTNAASSKTTPVDADAVGIIDSAASNALAKLTWANLKATLKTYLDTFYDMTGTATHAATGKTTPVDADEMGLIDSAASNVLKKVTWANIKATLKAYTDTLYSTILPTDVRRRGAIPKIIAGNRYLSNVVTFQPADSGAILANRIYATPFTMSEAHAWTKINSFINTNINGAKYRAGIYADNGSYHPGARILDAGEDVAVGTTAVAYEKTISFTNTADAIYWLLWHADSAISMQVSAANGIDFAFFGMPATVQAGNNGLRAYGCRVVDTAYAALPPTAPAMGFNQSAFPILGLVA